MAQKAAVDHGAISQEQAQCILSEFVATPLTKPITRLFGGFSAANYKVTVGAPQKAAAAASADEPATEVQTLLLKCCNDQPVFEAEEQAAAVEYLRSQGFETACPLRRLDCTGFTSKHLGPTRPSLVYRFLPGVNADTLCREGGKSVCSGVLASAGRTLAALHLVPPPPPGTVRHCLTSRGACMVGMQRATAAAMAESPHTADHPFTEFHLKMLPVLEEALRTPGLPEAILHGDPFLDNMLADPVTRELTGLIDWEDVAVGPVVFDAACCAVGCCYGPDNRLDPDRLDALLGGYAAVRPFSQQEAALFPTFCKVALLCNAAWRFTNFHINHREVEQARDSYKELHDRIVDLDAHPERLATALARAAGNPPLQGP